MGWKLKSILDDPKSQQFDKANSRGNKNLFSFEFLIRKCCLRERENGPCWAKLKGRLNLQGPRAQGRKMGSLGNGRYPKRIQIPSAKPSCAKSCSVDNSYWRGGIPNILWNSLITCQVSTLWWESPFLQQHVILAVLFLCMGDPSLQWSSPIFTTFIHMGENLKLHSKSSRWATTSHFLLHFAMSAITTEMTFQKLLRKAKTNNFLNKAWKC